MSNSIASNYIKRGELVLKGRQDIKIRNFHFGKKIEMNKRTHAMML
jgi:hypothetical protein